MLLQFRSSPEVNHRTSGYIGK